MSKFEAMVVGSAARLGIDEIVLLIGGIAVLSLASMALIFKLVY